MHDLKIKCNKVSKMNQYSQKKRKIRLGALELAKFQKNMPVSHTAHGDRK